jgi:hypothetical protein
MHVLKTLLLGTEKAQIDTNALPEIIKKQLSKVDDNETQLLRAAALSWVYESSGKSAPIINDFKIIIPQNETLPYSSPFAMSIWREIQVHFPKLLFFVEIWLKKVIQNQCIVTPDIVVSLLQLGNLKKAQYLRPYIAAVVGQRGIWMIQYNDAWSYLIETDDKIIFQEGKSSERIEALRRIRRKSATEARNVLAETWAKESLKDRKILLEVMSIDFSEEDMLQVTQWKKDSGWQENDPTLSIFQTTSDIENNIMKSPHILYRNDWQTLPLYFQWSPIFSKFMLSETYQSFQYAQFTKGKQMEYWAAHLHHSSKIDQIPHINDSYDQKYQWAAFCHSKLNKAIEIKQKINEM